MKIPLRLHSSCLTKHPKTNIHPCQITIPKALRLHCSANSQAPLSNHQNNFFTTPTRPACPGNSASKSHPSTTTSKISNFSTMTSSSSSTTSPSHASITLRYADVGINLSDPVYQGIYHGKRAHPSDLAQVIQRAHAVNCTKLMVTGSDLTSSRDAIDLAKQYPGTCYATVGVHPCSTQQFDVKGNDGGNNDTTADELLNALRTLAMTGHAAGHVVAFGEIGLDYDRLFLSPKETQLKYFERQLDLAVELQLPLFLHSRACSQDFELLLSARLTQLPKRGLVHSFTGTVEEMQRLVAMGFDIGLNGCSLKTEENLAVVKEVPLERLQIETDGPWCEIRPSHASAAYLLRASSAAADDDEVKKTPSSASLLASLPKAVKKEKWAEGLMVKGRNEPATIVQVAHVIAGVKGITVEEVCEAAWKNSTEMFGLGT